jgi:hypothetical protein
MPGIPGMPGTKSGDKKGSGDEAEEEYAPLWAYATVERQGKVKYTDIGGVHCILVENKWGRPINVPVAALGAYIQVPTLARRFESKVKADLKDGKSAERLLALAEWALERGLLAEFHKMIDELKAVAPDNQTLKFVEQVRAALKARPARDDPAAASLAEELGRESYRPIRSEQGHYTLLTNAKNAQNDPAVKRRLARMEETYEVFFYWFALKNRPRTLPAYRLVTVLVKEGDSKSSKEFDAKHQLFEQIPMVADGFTVRRDNTVVLASRRTDEAYNALVRNNHQMWSSKYKVSPRDLLNDNNITRRRTDLGGALPVLQTLALLQYAMEEESEWATVTHECVRQLEAATGLIPRNVNAAEWAQFGLASFFETPHHAFYASYAAPNWSHLISFKYLRGAGKLNSKQAGRVLLDVITDRYFRDAYAQLRQRAEVDEKQKEALAPKVRLGLEKARSSAWALTYYLAQNHLDKLLAYYKELASLPRDVEYDEAVLKQCFGRAFGLLTPDPTSPGQKVLDMGRLERMANGWFNSLQTTTLDVVEAEKEALDSRKGVKRGGNDQGGTQPGTNPGGRPPYGPGPGINPGGRPPYGPGPGGNPYGGGVRPGQPAGGGYRPPY